MNNVIRRNGICSLQQLHLLLKLNPSVKSFLGVPLASNSRNSFLEGKSNFGLLALQDEIRKASSENCDSLPRRDVPLKLISPLGILGASFYKISASIENVFTPQCKAGIGIRNNNSYVMSGVNSVKVRSELAVSVNVNHSLAVDESSKSNPINFSRHVVELREDSITMREI